MKLVVHAEAILEYENTNKKETNEFHLVKKGSDVPKDLVKRQSLLKKLFPIISSGSLSSSSYLFMHEYLFRIPLTRNYTYTYKKYGKTKSSWHFHPSTLHAPPLTLEKSCFAHETQRYWAASTSCKRQHYVGGGGG